MQVTLTPEQARFVEEKLKDGRFASASEAVGSAMALLMSQEELPADDVDELRAQILVGLEQSRRGESTPLDMAAVKERIRRLRSELAREGRS